MSTHAGAAPQVLRSFRMGHLFVFSLLVGFLAVSEWSLIPAQRHLDASAYTTLEQHMNTSLEYLTAGLMITSTVGAIGVLVLSVRARCDRRRIVLAWVALACIVVMVISTLIINAPVNFAIDAWDPAAPPSNWMQLRQRWEIGHTLRTYVGLLGLAAAIAGTVAGAGAVTGAVPATTAPRRTQG
jgi:uncharacterized membrane protein